MSTPTSRPELEPPPDAITPISGKIQISADNSGVPKIALRPKEACLALGIGSRLLWSLTNQGLIPHVRLGKAILYPTDALRTWLAEQAGKGMKG